MQKNSVSKRLWGKVADTRVYLFKMVNDKGGFVEISNYGATIVSINTHDKNGNPGDVVLGFPSLQSYVHDQSYIGATVGRFANRIANASFSLNGRVYRLEQNDGPNSNHSGGAGFNKRVFSYEINGDTLIFKLFSPDGEGGFPGNLKVQVQYRWTNDNELKIDYFGESDQNTLFNLTNHSYFDLSAGEGRIFDHQLSIHADQVVEAGLDYIPTGKIIDSGTNYAFSDTMITNQIFKAGDKIVGLNICYVLNEERQALQLPAAVLSDYKSGRRLSVYTSYPGLLLYTGDYLNSTHKGHQGRRYKPYDGLCLEAQYYPDSPNHSSFPSAELASGKTVHHFITFKFDTHK